MIVQYTNVTENKYHLINTVEQNIPKSPIIDALAQTRTTQSYNTFTTINALQIEVFTDKISLLNPVFNPRLCGVVCDITGLCAGR